MKNIQLTTEQNAVLDEMLYGTTNLDIQGKAGVGKSSIIQAFQSRSINRLVSLAPTGVAAQNINGATIHSFFKLPMCTIDPRQLTIDSQRQLELLQHTDTFLFDESSMIRSDIFEAIDWLLKTANDSELPFGGKRVILMGDMFQLPPIVASEEIRIYLEHAHGGCYYFNSRAFGMGRFSHLFLKQPHRQSDPFFIEFLDSIRQNRPNLATYIRACNERLLNQNQFSADHLCLCCTRREADLINQSALSRLPDRGVVLQGRTQGKFPLDEIPTDLNLSLKHGARVMILINRANLTIGGYDFVNGATGIIVGYDLAMPSVTVELDNGATVTIREHCWQNYEYDIEYGDRGSIELVTREVGVFWQLPIIPAYAVTIHKSQGQTLDKAHLVLGGGCFASGQLYTAISRVRSLNDLSIDRPVSIFETMVDPQVLDYYYSICPDIC